MAKNREGRKVWLFYLAVGSILLALPAGYLLLLGQEVKVVQPVPLELKPPANDTKVDAVATAELKLTDTSGTVQIRRGSADWAAAKLGEVIHRSDGLRTRDGSRATLLGGSAYEVRMEPGTEVVVSELSDSISRLMLGSGMASAKVYSAMRHRFEMTTPEGAKAWTKAGNFTISTNGAGAVSVGAQEGEVEFEGGGKAVIVRAGYQSSISRGGAPTSPTVIPSSLMLRVNLPTIAAVRTPRLVVSGQVEVGALVEIDGRTIMADKQGRFSHQVQLREGHNALAIRARSVGGRETVEQHQIDLDTRIRKTVIDPNLWEGSTEAP